jgi:integrase
MKRGAAWAQVGTCHHCRSRVPSLFIRVASAAWAHSGLVFTTRAGTPFEPRNLNRRIETRCAKAGVRRITVHDMRHTCATLLAALDVHPRVAMRILRHAQIDVTMNVYTEVSDAKTLQALKRLGRQLGS